MSAPRSAPLPTTWPRAAAATSREVPTQLSAPAIEAAEITVGAAPQAVGWARRWVLRQVELLAAAPDVCATAELLVSELVTNAVCHSGSDDVITVRVHPFDDTVLVAVHDAGHALPVLGVPAPDDVSGRGLPLVDHLAAEWGADAAPGGGKTVWFRLEL